MKQANEKLVLKEIEANSNPSETQRQLRLVTEISKQISLINNPQELCLMIVNLLQILLDYEYVAIWLLEADAERLVLEAVSNVRGESVERKRLGRVEKHHAVVQAWQNGESCLALADSSSSILAIPILNLNDTIAVLEIHRAGTNAFSTKDYFLLELLANQLSAAFRSVSLFIELEKAKEEAELANRLKSQFLASMSGTLRAPLTSILNWTEFMLGGLMGRLTKEQTDILGMVSANTELVLAYINDGLDISRIKVGKALLFVEDVDIADVLADSHDLLLSSVVKKPIRIETEIAPDMPRIRGDQRRLEQIFLSIVSNALKFTHEGTISLKAYHRDASIYVEISDTGKGIAPEAFETVFKDRHNGVCSAYALERTKQLVEAHCGKISFESEVNKGTTFYLELCGVQES